ncbi:MULTISPECIES: hypothetical protein [Cytobacillus]|nr:hypothetical protein [Cytobacillus kochii]MCA1026161.1 hypothetical protein [Cytobacillus kochii]MCM3321238.1 hypothetical protein [Cytobacillus kochii]MCM3343928.1 hypothetical protein [Cytobacillus kochii]MDM5207773.1 hypothetical protein [Cytobacillus kochii]
MSSKEKRFTVAGTDINEVKRLNQQSGLSYNEVKALLAAKYLNSKNERN